LRNWKPWLCALVLMWPLTSHGEPIKLKLSFFTSDRSEAYQTAVKPFVDAVNADAKGLIEIQVYFSGALGADQTKTAYQVRDGAVDIAFVVTGLAPELFSDNTVLEMPGLFRNAREATLAFTRLTAVNTLKGYEDFHIIGSLATAPEKIHSRPPVASLKDLVGLRIGTNNPTEGAALKKLGMRPVILPVNEYSNALGADRIDAVAKSVSIVSDFGIGRIVTYHYMLGTSVLPMALLMNRQKLAALPRTAQDVIRKYSGEWMAARFIEGYDAIEKDALTKLKDDPNRHVVFPSAADLNRAQNTYRSFVADWAAQSPQNAVLLGKVEAELSRIRSGQ
jgi:TRAP-type C4-dicarboxylate transport system substrate-binding protein